MTRTLRVVVLASSLGFVPAILAAQRSEQVTAGQQAYGNGERRRAIELLSAAINPSLGSLDSVWSIGVQTLVEVLEQNRQPALASYYARWALRQVPAMVIDTINLLPVTVGIFRDARAEVRGPRETRVETTWRWGTAPDPATPGSIRLLQGNLASRVALVVVGEGQVSAGEAMSLAPKSYQLRAEARGYLPQLLTREVLPGVETIVSFELLPESAGWLYVAAQPWGMVFIDDQRIGPSTIVAHRVASGSHRVRIQRDGYAPVDTVVQVDRDTRVRLAVRLERRP